MLHPPSPFLAITLPTTTVERTTQLPLLVAPLRSLSAIGATRHEYRRPCTRGKYLQFTQSNDPPPKRNNVAYIRTRVASDEGGAFFAAVGGRLPLPQPRMIRPAACTAVNAEKEEGRQPFSPKKKRKWRAALRRDWWRCALACPMARRRTHGTDTPLYLKCFEQASPSRQRASSPSRVSYNSVYAFRRTKASASHDVPSGKKSAVEEVRRHEQLQR